MMKIIQAFLLSLIVLLNVACSNSTEPPPKGTPLAKWTDEQLVAKGKQAFEAANYKSSLPYLREAAKRDNPDAQYALGFMHYYGLAGQRNLELAQDLIRRSAEKGHQPAVRALRLFIATKSNLTVDSNKSTYIAKNTAQSKPDSNLLADNTTNAITKTKISDVKTNKTIITKPVEIAQKTSDTKDPVQKKSSQQTKQMPAKLSNTQPAQSKSKVPPAKEQSKVLITNTKQDKNPISQQVSKASNRTANTKTVKKTDTNSVTIVQQPSQKKLTEIKAVSNRLALDINKKWLSKQQPDQYTIQVITSESLKEIETFISNNNLQNKLHIFSYTHNNKQWYGAGFGVYAKPDEAYSTMLNDIPPALVAQKPWVRQFKNIHQNTNIS